MLSAKDDWGRGSVIRKHRPCLTDIVTRQSVDGPRGSRMEDRSGDGLAGVAVSADRCEEASGQHRRTCENALVPVLTV